MTPAPAALVVEPAFRSVGNGRYKTAVFHDLDGSVDGVPDLSVANPKSSGFSLIQPGNEPLSNHRRLTRSMRSRQADTSRRNCRVMQPATMRLPAVRT